MMTAKIKKMYKLAKADECFKADFIKYGNKEDVIPGIFAGTVEKVFFATTYYGWLIAKQSPIIKEIFVE